MAPRSALLPRRRPAASSAAALAAALLPSTALGDLGAGLRRRAAGSAPGAAGAGSGAPLALPAVAPLDDTIVIPLRRVAARASSSSSAGEASFYLGTVRVGEPAQELQVLFDTSSGHALLPHRACKSAACKEHASYSPWSSSSAVDVNINGGFVQAGQRIAHGKGVRDGVTLSYTQADLGEGDAKAVLVHDRICLGHSLGAGAGAKDGSAEAGAACLDMGILAATSLADAPFRGMPNDGVIGLGLEPLAAGPILSFLGRTFADLRPAGRAVPQFGLFLGAEGGELHLGGIAPTPRLAEPLRWFPVDHPEQGYWQVAVRAVRVGNVTVDACRRGCHAVVDSGASRLGVQASHLEQLKAALLPRPSSSGGASSSAARCLGPELSIDLVGGISLTLEADDYADSRCSAAQLGALDLPEPEFSGIYALGTNVLRRYYAAFDWKLRRLGFARLAEDQNGADAEANERAAKAEASAAWEDEEQAEPTIVIF